MWRLYKNQPKCTNMEVGSLLNYSVRSRSSPLSFATPPLEEESMLFLQKLAHLSTIRDKNFKFRYLVVVEYKTRLSEDTLHINTPHRAEESRGVHNLKLSEVSRWDWTVFPRIMFQYSFSL